MRGVTDVNYNISLGTTADRAAAAEALCVAHRTDLPGMGLAAGGWRISSGPWGWTLDFGLWTLNFTAPPTSAAPPSEIQVKKIACEINTDDALFPGFKPKQPIARRAKSVSWLCSGRTCANAIA
jgi:hypothetical protein